MILSIGEIVWDIFASNKVLGGAPLNVAYHLSCLNLHVHLISRIGRDDLARKTLQRLDELDLPAKGVQLDHQLPTGQVVVTIGNDNEPSYDIVAPAAWDVIELPSPDSLPASPFNLVFGSLAQRSKQSRSVIRSLWDEAEMIFYDVNLRPPYTPATCVLDSLAVSHVVKMNDHELREIADWKKTTGDTLPELAKNLFGALPCQVLAVTLGSKGALLVCESGLFEHTGYTVQVVDTVGAGDAFFASLIDGIIKKRPWQNCLEEANKRGALVAGKSGATPPMNDLS